ncbi:unnamed protein product [Urochloa humidicola]
MSSRAPLFPSMSSLPLLSLVLLFFFCTAAVMACDPGDRGALLRVKAQLGDPARLSSWRATSANCCAWDPAAVACGGGTSSSAGRVTSLALCSLPDVSARVPAALSDLAALEILQIVSVPGLSGPFPASFAGLTRLHDVNINGTAISGPVPAALLAGAANLSTLVIANSKLAGPMHVSAAPVVM